MHTFEKIISSFILLIFLSSNISANDSIKVLILNSWSPEHNWVKGEVQGIKDALQIRHQKIEFTTEYIDYPRVEGIDKEIYIQHYHEFFNNKYKDQRINFDIIFVTDDPALSYMLQYHDKYFPDTPVVFCGINNYSLKKTLEEKDLFFGILENVDYLGTLRIAHKLHPQAKKFYILGDQTTTSQNQIAEIKKVSSKFPLEFEYLDNLTFSELSLKLQSLTTDDIVFLMAFYSDSTGKQLTPKESINFIKNNSVVPIYSFWKWILGHDSVLGGKVLSSYDHGTDAVEKFYMDDIKKRFLVEGGSNPYIFDYNQLKRFDIKLKDLPSSSQIINKPFSFYETYKTLVNGTIFFIIVLLILLSILLLNIKKRKIIEKNLKTSKKELRKLNQSLEYKVEKRTKEQNSLLSLFEKGDSVLFRWNNDEKWTVDYVSSNVSNLTGYTKEDFNKGLISYSECIHKDDLQQIIDQDIYRKKEGKEFFRHDPYRIIKKDRSIIWILEYSLIIRDKKGEITHYLGYILDETSNQKAKEELEIAKRQAQDASNAKSEFLANMSHEIRTPMNGIIGMTTLALSKIDEDVVQAKDFTKKANNSAKMLLGIINDILDFSKIEAGKLEIEQKQVSLGEILSQMNDLFSYTASQKDIKFIIEYDKIVPEYIIGDKLRLTQVLTNLISNAVKFTQKGTIKLKIELLSKDEENIQLKFLVHDTGKGISKENQHKLFQSFSQEDNSISREYGGTGLGLTISKNLVELMNGEIGFDSIENQGSTFFFTLNTQFIEEKSIEKKEDKKLNNKEGEILDASILVVEDNDINQELAYNFLSQIIKEVDIANNGQEAINIIESKENDYYKLILMDIHMPILDGNNATIKIRENPKYKDIPIVAMTANVLEKEINYSLKCGMSDYVTKPFEVQELFDKVKYWVNKKEKVKTVTVKEEIQFINKPLNTKEALERMLDRKDLYKDFLEKYIKNRKDSFNEIVQLIEKNDLVEAITQLHSLRGMLLTMGAMRLSEMLFKMEESLKTKEEVDGVLIDGAKAEMVLVIDEIKEWINNN